MDAIFGAKLLRGTAEEPTAAALAGKKAVGLYFSAHWCPPCKMFTPQLAKQYEAHYKAKGLEIVYVSSDRDEESFEAHFAADMPWVALPYAARERKSQLARKYRVAGLPALVILEGGGR